MNRAHDDDHAEPSPSSSRIAAAIGTGPTGSLAARAGAALVREEMAHVLAAPMSFLAMIVGELEAGRPISADHVGIAREEVARMQRLIASLRDTPAIEIAGKAVRVEPVLRAVRRDLAQPSAHPRVELVLDVRSDLVAVVDAAALGFVAFSVVSALAGRGAKVVRIAQEVQAKRAILVFTTEGTEPLDRSVFAARAWASGDPHALTFAIARRAARAAEMRLRPPMDDTPNALRLEIPIV